MSSAILSSLISNGAGLNVWAPPLVSSSPSIFGAIAYASGFANIELDASSGKVGDWIAVNGSGFDADKIVHMYFSSNNVLAGNTIGTQVTAYEDLNPSFALAYTDDAGKFMSYYHFTIPDRLRSGKIKQDVHDGDYYVYATYFTGGTETIQASAHFTLIDGTVILDNSEKHVGDEVDVTGEGLRSNQKINLEFDGRVVAIVKGDIETNGDGAFDCVIVVPEVPSGNHTVTAIDESGDRPNANLEVGPKIAVEPASAATGEPVHISGTGFGEVSNITFTLNGTNIASTPAIVVTNHLGSFDSGFQVPSNVGSAIKLVAVDTDYNSAETSLTSHDAIVATRTNLTVTPLTSVTSPGYVGLNIILNGTGFRSNSTVTVTYDGDKVHNIATAVSDGAGGFSITFNLPSGSAGSHALTATDGSNAQTIPVIMESEAPPMPRLILPENTAANSNWYFDWTDVTDPSGVTYALQVASDAAFNNLTLVRNGLTLSEYTVPDQDRSLTGGSEYYWRVKAADGAGNESAWTPPRLFQVPSPSTSLPAVVRFALFGFIGLLLVILGLWVRRLALSRRNIG